MSLLATAGDTKEFELCPAGNHVARCYSVVDLGYQDTEWQGVHKSVRKVRISWELPSELMDDGRPFSVSANYTLSLGEKANLRRDLQSWRGRPFTEEELRGFDIETVVGVPAMVNVVHNTARDGRTYANVGSISPLPKGLECPPAVNERLVFSTDSYTAEEFSALPEWLQKKISLPDNMSPTPSGADQYGSIDDDIPF